MISVLSLRNISQVEIVRVAEIEAIDHLTVESLSQGFRFVDRLVKEYRCGHNRFKRSGEILLTAMFEEKAIAICGLNQDPYSNSPVIGRLRHLYVELSWRRFGVGRLLVSRIINEANKHYEMLTLRTDASEADRFYQALGFKTNLLMPQTTHYLELNIYKQ